MGISGLDHVAITAGDVERTVAWYRDVLGAEVLYLDLWRDGVLPVVILQLGASRLSVHDAAAPASPAAAVPTVGAADVCFRWSGPLADAVDQLSRAGVPVVEGPVERPASNGVFGRSVYVHDPDGNLVELLSLDG